MGGHGRVVRNIVALLVNQIGTWSISLLITLVLPPYLGPARYGLYAFVGSYVGLFALGMNLGTGTYLTWRIAREPEQAGRLTFNTLLLQVPLALAAGLLALVTLPSLDNQPLVYMLTAISVVSATISALSGTLSAALAGFQLLRVPARLALFTMAVGAVLMVLGVVRHADLLYLTYVGLLSQCIGFVTLLVYTQRKIALTPRLDLRLWRTILLGGLPFFGWSAALLVYGQIDISMLKVLAGNTQVGWYSVAYRIISIPVFLPTIIISALLPALSAERNFESPQFRMLASRSIRLVAAVGIPACAGTVMLAAGLLKLLHYPASFASAAPLIIILAPHMPVVGLDMVLATAIIAIGRQRAWTVVGIVAAIFNPLVNLWAIPYTLHHYGNGAIGAAAVTVLTELLTLVGALILRPRTVFTRGDVFYIFRCLLAAGVMVPTVWALSAQPRVGVVAAVAYGVLIYVMAAYTLQVVRNEDLVALANTLAGRLGAGSVTTLDLHQIRELLGFDQLRRQGAAIVRGLRWPGVQVGRLFARLAPVPAARQLAPAMEHTGHRDINLLADALVQDRTLLSVAAMPVSAVEIGALASASSARHAAEPRRFEHAAPPVAVGERELALAGASGVRAVATGRAAPERLAGTDGYGEHERNGGGGRHHVREAEAGEPELGTFDDTSTHRDTVTSISVVICTYGRADSIERAITSVAEQGYTAFDVLVMDQSRTDETRHIVERLMWRFPRVKYIHLDEVGLSRAYNAGIRHTTGELLAFTDDDCVAPEGWLSVVAQSFAAAPDVQLIYGQVLVPDELREREGRDGHTPVLPIARRQRLNRREGFRVFGMGANFAARRAVFERVGGFDEVLGGGGPLKSSQDFDFAYRVFRAGGTILLEPDLTVYHYGFRAAGDWPATMRAYGVGDGAFYFKHVRAGDPHAAWLLARTLGQHTLRELAHTLGIGRRQGQWHYVRSVFVGMRDSLKFGVDRHRRLYSVRQRG
jgi:O-antigen/teichoic acid export membrane protein/GT2 family glycosyltransferase